MTGQLLEDLGWVGNGPKMPDVIEGKYAFSEDCPPDDARDICEQTKIVHEAVSEGTLNVVIRMDLFQRWWRNAREDTQSSMSAIHFGHLMTAASYDYLTRLYVKKLNCALARKPLSRWGESLVVLLEKVFGSIMFEKLRAIILFEADLNWIQKVVYSKHMNKMIKKHNIMPEDQCAQSGKH